MKVLWITNVPFAHHCDMLGLDKSRFTSGTWLYAAYEASQSHEDIELHIVTTASVSNAQKSKINGTTFHILPGISAALYNPYSAENERLWQSLRDEISPDIVIVWGTETPFAYLGMKTMHGIPMTIYVQGVISAIYEHYFDGVPHKYHLSTMRDVYDAINPKSYKNLLKKQLLREREMFKMASAVMGENDWCIDTCRSINPELKYFHNLLPIREIFYQRSWNIDKMRRHTIFTNAGGFSSAIKGHHVLFKALAIVKQKFPDVKCFIPGPSIKLFDDIKRRGGYVKYLKKILQQEGLSENIIYTGTLTSDEITDYISSCNVYVMPSLVENHSSSRIEAMLMGAPVISSMAGGATELIVPKKNGLLYNSLDAESLAGNIIRIFEDDNLAIALSKYAVHLREERPQNFGQEMINIYKAMINQ